jgi:hypothetical protein
MSKRQNLHTKYFVKNKLFESSDMKLECQTLHFSFRTALEPEPSSLFWLHTSVDVASDMPAS